MDQAEYTNPVRTHGAIADAVSQHFSQIFAYAEREPMQARLNNLRMASTVWDRDKRDFVETDKAPLLSQLAELAAAVVQVRYKGMSMTLNDEPEETKALHRKQYHDMCMILYRHEKQYRKSERPVPLCMFTPGTVVEYEVEYVSKGAQVVTVATVSETDRGYGIITTKETHMVRGWSAFNSLPFPVSRPDSFNTSHVKRVISHKPGTLKYTGDGGESASRNYAAYDAINIHKARNSYLTYRGASFAVTAALECVGVPRDPNQQLNQDALRQLVFRACPGLKERLDPDTDCDYLIKVPKKKLRRFVRQNMNRFLTSRSEQEANEREYQRRMDADFEDDLRHLDDRLAVPRTERRDDTDGVDPLHANDDTDGVDRPM